MKRFFLLIFAFAVLTASAGCRQDSAAAPGFGLSDLCIVIDGDRFGLNVNIEAVIQLLGEGYVYSEAISCDYDGLDKTFEYETAIFYTFPLSEGDIVGEIYSDNPTASSSKGIRVGDRVEDVLSAYGDGCEDTGYQLIYRMPDLAESAGEGSLCFDVSDGAVTGMYITTQTV